MEIEATLNKDGKEMKAVCSFDLPPTVAGLLEKYGEDKVYGYAKRAIVVSIQNAMRAELGAEGPADAPLTDDQRVINAAEAGAKWTPPEPRTTDPVKKAVKALKDLGLSEEQMAAVEASIRAETAKAAPV